MKKISYILVIILAGALVVPQLCNALSITYGSEAVFQNDGLTINTTADVLDDTHVIIAYHEGVVGRVIVAEISGTSISYGTPCIFASGASQNGTYISVVALDATHALIAYRYDISGRAKIATITGKNVVCGSEYTYNYNRQALYNSAVALDDTHVLIAYRDVDNSSYGTAIIAEVDGTTIDFGIEYVFNSATTNFLSAAGLDSNNVLIAYRDDGNSLYGTAIIATISGSTISFGPPNVFNNAETRNLSSTTLDSNNVLIAYKDVGNLNYGTAIIAGISGTSISYGSEYVFNNAETGAASYGISTSSLDANNAIIAYTDVGGSSYGTAIIATISDTIISYGPPNAFNEAAAGIISSVDIDATHALIAYADAGNNDYGTGIIATINPDPPTVTNSTGASNVAASTARLNGEVTSTGGEDPTVHVYWGDEDGVTTPLDWDTDVNLGTKPAGTFYTDISSLSPNTTYYYRCYATNSGGNVWADATASFITGSVVTVTGTSIAPVDTTPGATGVGFLKLGLATGSGEASWTDAKVDLTGTAVDGDISLVEVWKDDGDGIWEGPGEDIEIGSGTFSSRTVEIDIIDQTISTSSQDFFIVYNIDAEAEKTHTAGAELTDETYVTVTSPDEVSSSGFPINSDLTTLPVILSDFTAQFLNKIATLYWSTASENDNIGWNVYRNCNENYIDAIRINNELIPGYGTTTQPHDYIYHDSELEPTAGDVYWYWIQSVDFGGTAYLYGPIELSIPEIPDPGSPEVPSQYGLHQNWPNPFKVGETSTKISFALHTGGFAELNIYNIQGQLVKNLYKSTVNSDEEIILKWDGKDDQGVGLQPGIYFYQLDVNDTLNEIKRLIILR